MRRDPRAAELSTPRAQKPRRDRRAGLTGPERLEDRRVLSLAFGNTLGAGGQAGGANAIQTTDVAYDPAGNRYISGSFTGTVAVGTATLTSVGGRDAFVAKFAPDGTLVYAKGVGSKTDDRATGVAVDAAGEAFVTGFITGTASFGGPSLSVPFGYGLFLWKLNAAGTTQFATDAFDPTASTSSPLGIAVDAAGRNIAIGGEYVGTAQFANVTITAAQGAQDGFVAKADSAGNFVWATSLAATGNQTAAVERVALDGSGNVVGVGEYTGTLNFGNNLPAVTSRGSSDLLVASFTAAAGLASYGDSAGGAGLDTATGVAVDPATGAAYVVGAYQGTAQFDPAGGTASATSLTAPASTTGFYLLGLTTAGKYQSVTALAGTNSDTTGANLGRPSLATDGNGTLAAALTYTGTAAAGNFTVKSMGSSDVLVEELNTAGAVLALQSAGGAGVDTATGVAFTSAGRVAVTGSYTGPAFFGPTALAARSVGTGSAGDVFLSSLYQFIPSDFDGSGRSELSIFRPSNAGWYAKPAGYPGHLLATFGAPNFGDIPVPGDYDGVGHTELAVFRPSTGQWLIDSPGGVRTISYGARNLTDIPVPGDYDGVGHTELAVFRPATAQWFVMSPTGGHLFATFGAAGLRDIPIPGDYDGVGRTELAVFRPATAQWFVMSPTGGHLFATYGGANLSDIPVPGDYDGVGRTELAVFRPATAQWFVRSPSGGHLFATYGAAGLGDYPTEAPTGSLVALRNSVAKGGIRANRFVGDAPKSTGPLSEQALKALSQRRPVVGASSSLVTQQLARQLVATSNPTKV